jgi:cytidyltransferase-like protein
MIDTGVIHGRFQPFHLGHLEYVMEGKRRCRFLYVGIANPDPSSTASHSTNIARGTIEANPFTYWERALMIERTLVNEGVAREEFTIVPFPINFPERLRFYVPTTACFFLTIYDDWGRAKYQTLSDLGLNLNIMWERGQHELLTSGTEIRKLIAAGQPWQQLVPSPVAKVVMDLGLDQRIQESMRRLA